MALKADFFGLAVTNKYQVKCNKQSFTLVHRTFLVKKIIKDMNFKKIIKLLTLLSKKLFTICFSSFKRNKSVKTTWF